MQRNRSQSLSHGAHPNRADEDGMMKNYMKWDLLRLKCKDVIIDLLKWSGYRFRTAGERGDIPAAKYVSVLVRNRLRFNNNCNLNSKKEENVYLIFHVFPVTYSMSEWFFIRNNKIVFW